MQNEQNFLNAVSKNANKIQYVNHPTNEICLEAVNPETVHNIPLLDKLFIETITKIFFK
jgi:hypothetical protein